LITNFRASALKISLREPLADRQQILPALRARFWVSHFKSFKRIEDNPGYDEPGILPVVGGNDIPGSVSRRAANRTFSSFWDSFCPSSYAAWGPLPQLQ
jgi:hypothetical protein